MQDMIKEWEKLKLTDDENLVVMGNSNAETEDNSNNQLRLALVGRLCTVKPFNVDAMKKTLTNVWRLKCNIAIRTMDTNLFVFQFFNEADKSRILEGMPWFFDGKLLLFKEIQGGEQPSKIEFKKIPIWVRLLDVPFNKRNPSTIREIGESLGGFVEIDDSDPLGWECSQD
ncbi:uncharacterized protein LOC110723340 [Chenopodium quinoa]|uniref:uncharacterized protein LOC110723340 n=1 Tax=Chenopodium quinoa TaxID=63459 RepID=UPI000B79A077|nr:uncharacterized protein LOC110723340 [Chenopodium quinoa]